MNKEIVFTFLDDLRESGITNMFGSGPYVQEAFGIDRYEARDLVLEWMKTFNERNKPTEESKQEKFNHSI